jgi:hypothetical protein
MIGFIGWIALDGGQPAWTGAVLCGLGFLALQTCAWINVARSYAASREFKRHEGHDQPR